MKKEINIVPFESIPQLITGSFLTNDQVKKLKDAFKDFTVVVRCKDCKYWDKGHTEECDNLNSVCFHNGWCKPDWFCADGERKTNVTTASSGSK